MVLKAKDTESMRMWVALSENISYQSSPGHIKSPSKSDFLLKKILKEEAKDVVENIMIMSDGPLSSSLSDSTNNVAQAVLHVAMCLPSTPESVLQELEKMTFRNMGQTGIPLLSKRISLMKVMLCPPPHRPFP